jgi:hypothetical protein
LALAGLVLRDFFDMFPLPCAAPYARLAGRRNPPKWKACPPLQLGQWPL